MFSTNALILYLTFLVGLATEPSWTPLVRWLPTLCKMRTLYTLRTHLWRELPYLPDLFPLW